MRKTTSKHKEMQHLIRSYKSETGETEVSMHEVANWAVNKGWPLPVPTDPIERLAAEFTQAAREELKIDELTKQPYRVNHAYQVGQMTFWIDIDEAPREPMRKSLIARREQMVGDGLQLTLDADHWNTIHPDEEPIQIPLDFNQDIQWRKMGLQL